MISVESVTKRYGALTAVDGVSFEVQRGEVVGFLGPNGAGKTTTMRMLAGTLQPDSGAVRLDGRPISEDLTAARQRIGYMPESNALYTEMLVSEYLDFAAELRGLRGADRRSALRDAIEQTGIGDVYYRPISQLSKGYRQRVGLAAAILHRPEVLILDEPTEGLDPNQRIEIRRLIRELGKDRTVILSTHVLGEVEATCSRLLIISRGRVAADGGVAELLDRGRAGARYVVEAEGDDVAATLAALPGVTQHSSTRVDGRARVELTASGDTDLRPLIFRSAMERGWTLWELHRERQSLEELFRELTGTAAPSEPLGAGPSGLGSGASPLGSAPSALGSGAARLESHRDVRAASSSAGAAGAEPSVAEPSAAEPSRREAAAEPGPGAAAERRVRR